MKNSDAQRIEELQDQVYALQQLLLSLYAALDDEHPALVDHAFRIAGTQSAAALKQGRNRVAIRIDAAVEDIKQRRQP